MPQVLESPLAIPLIIAGPVFRPVSRKPACPQTIRPCACITTIVLFFALSKTDVTYLARYFAALAACQVPSVARRFRICAPGGGEGLVTRAFRNFCGFLFVRFHQWISGFEFCIGFELRPGPLLLRHPFVNTATVSPGNAALSSIFETMLVLGTKLRDVSTLVNEFLHADMPRYRVERGYGV